jgi:hypothetical protein
VRHRTSIFWRWACAAGGGGALFFGAWNLAHGTREGWTGWAVGAGVFALFFLLLGGKRIHVAYDPAKHVLRVVEVALVQPFETPIADVVEIKVQEGTRPDPKGKIEQVRRVAIVTKGSVVGAGPWLSQDAIGWGNVDGDRLEVAALVDRARAHAGEG